MSLPDPDSTNRDLLAFMLIGFGSMVITGFNLYASIEVPIEGAIDFFAVFALSWGAYKLGKG